MTANKKFSELRKKDPVINTFPWEGLKNSPEIVEENYLSHAITHMSLGDTGKYITELKRNVTVNKSCSVGAIVGPYGYGKTSTAIHVWKESQEKLKFLSIPPFEWFHLTDIIEAVTAWVIFKFNQGPKQFVDEVKTIYEKYRDKTINELAKELGISEEKAIVAYEDGKINLGVSPLDVINFLVEISDLSVKKGGFKGFVVFIDELQETADKYSSIKDFQTDLFAFADKIPTKQGKLALIFTMPDTLEATINTTRPDIIHRLKQSSLYLRVEAIYGRDFPKKLWDKYSEVFNFEDEKYNPIHEETLDAIGQIAMRKDLGAGPRTVINAIIEAIKHNDLTSKAYTPIDLVNGFLDGKISFEERGKLSVGIKRSLENRIVSSKPEFIKTIKLCGAYPLGCPSKTIKKYNLDVALDHLVETEIYGEILYSQSEGYTLRSVLEEKVEADPTYIRLIKDMFIRAFAPDHRHAVKALKAFQLYILRKIFDPGKPNQIDKWQWTSENNEQEDLYVYSLVGSFSNRFPHRDVRLFLGVSDSEPQQNWGKSEDLISMAFLLSYGVSSEHPNVISFPPEEYSFSEVFFNSNLLHISNTEINIPRIQQLYPTNKISPLFLLSMLNFLDEIEEKIPAPEKTGELLLFRNRLIEYSIRLLFGENLEFENHDEIEVVGETLIRKVFLNICERQYPNYQTLITNSKWQKNLQMYIKALQDPKITPRIARGKDPLISTKDYVVSLFGETSVQRVKAILEKNLSMIVQIEDWGTRGSDDAVIRFKLHPLESILIKILEDSPTVDHRKEGQIRKINASEFILSGKKMGYTLEEIGLIIRIMQARQYIAYNQKKEEIEQFIRSLDDIKESVDDRLIHIESEVRNLINIPDFEPHRFYSRIENVKSKLENLDNIEDSDEILESITSMEYGLKKYITKGLAYEINQAEKTNQKIEQIIKSGIPVELNKKIPGGEAPWASSIEESRQRSKKRYDELIIEYKNLRKKINALSSLDEIEDPKSDNFVSVIKECQDIHYDYKRLMNQQSGLMARQSQLIEWKNLLQRSNQLHEQALTAKVSFNEDSFLDIADSIWVKIKKDFASAPIDVLADHDKYENEIANLERIVSQWQKSRREIFLNHKRKLQDTLQQVGDDRPMLKTNFDAYTSAKENLRQLTDEAEEHLKLIIDKLLINLNSLLNEYYFAIEIQQVNLDSDPKSIEDSINKTNNIYKKISPELLVEEKKIDTITKELLEIIKIAHDLNKSIYKAISIRPPEGKDENEILDILKNNQEDTIRGVELKKVILSLMETQKEPDLENIAKVLISLFKKNQINLRIHRRRE